MSEVIINPFGTTFEIEVDNYKGLKKCTVNFPNRKQFFSIITKISNGGDDAVYDVGEKILSDGFVAGDPEFLTDDIYMLLGALQAVNEFETRSNFIKKN